MKKSEYRERRKAIHLESRGALVASAAERADQDIAAVEALPGWKWDPEEPELPGRVNLGMHGRSVHDFTGTTLFTVVPTQEPLPRVDVLAALVSLWNAWGPEGTLRKKLKEDMEHVCGPLWGELLAKPWEEK